MAANTGSALLRASRAAVGRRFSTSAAADVAAPPQDRRRVTPLYRRLSALGNASEDSVAKTMNRWLREGKRVRGIDVVRLVTKLQKYGRFNHALELMKWMDARGMNMHYSDYALRLQLLSKVEGIASAENFFSRLSEPAKNFGTYEALFSCYCVDKMEDKAIALLEKMKQLNYASTFVYNNLMTLYMKLEQPKKVVPLLHQMRAEKVAPNMITYCLVLNSYALLGDVASVEQLVEVMRKQDAHLLRWPIYGTLASFYISQSLVKKAESSLKMLEETMDVNNQECYHYLISLYSKICNLAEVTRIWEKVVALPQKVTNKSYFILLSALDRLNHLDVMKDRFKEWESSCSSYDIRLASLVIKAFLRRDMIEDAELVLKDAALKTQQPDFYIFQIFIDYCLAKKRTDLALKCVEDVVLKVKNQVWKPSKHKADMFLRYLRDQCMDGGEAFFDILERLEFMESDTHSVTLSSPAAEERPPLHQLFRHMS